MPEECRLWLGRMKIISFLYVALIDAAPDAGNPTRAIRSAR